MLLAIYLNRYRTQTIVTGRGQDGRVDEKGRDKPPGREAGTPSAANRAGSALSGAGDIS